APARAEVAEAHLLAGCVRHAHRDAAGAVVAADQLVPPGRPVVERTDHGDRAVMDVVRKHQLELGPAVVWVHLDPDRHDLSSAVARMAGTADGKSSPADGVRNTSGETGT